MRNHHGAANRKTKLILTKGALGNATGVFKKVGGVELIVAEEFPGRAVKFVGAGLDGGIQNRGAGAAEFGAETGGLDAELLNGVDRGKNDEISAVQEVDRVGVVVDAVEKIVVLGGAQPVGGKSAACGIAARIRLRRVAAGAELRENGEVAAVQGQVIDGFRIGDLANSGVLRLEKRSGCGDFDRLRDIAGLKGEILNNVDTDVHNDALHGNSLESLKGGFDLVAADPDGSEFVHAIGARRRGQAGARASLVRVTDAPATTAPVWSVTVPRIEPVSTCACRGAATSRSAARTTKFESV